MNRLPDGRNDMATSRHRRWSVDRRAALGVCSVGALAGLGAALAIQNGYASPASNLPRGIGYNISPQPSDYSAKNVWGKVWTEWDWSAKLRRDVDLAVASNSDVVRLIGGPSAFLDGHITEAKYLSRLEQLLLYCRDKGIRLYYCLGDLREFRGRTIPSRRLRNHAGRVSRLLGQCMPASAGIDLVNELAAVYPEYGGTIRRADAESKVASWVSVCRQAAPGLAITVSEIDPRWRQGRPLSGRLSKSIDFVDVHVYNVGDIARLGVLSQRKVVLGEVGGARGAGAGASALAAALASVRDGRIEAALQWDIASDNFGLFDSNGLNRNPSAWRAFAYRWSR